MGLRLITVHRCDLCETEQTHMRDGDYFDDISESPPHGWQLLFKDNLIEKLNYSDVPDNVEILVCYNCARYINGEINGGHCYRKEKEIEKIIDAARLEYTDG